VKKEIVLTTQQSKRKAGDKRQHPHKNRKRKYGEGAKKMESRQEQPKEPFHYQGGCILSQSPFTKERIRRSTEAVTSKKGTK